jgi:probable F420-dependent oxidoreductase
MTAPRPDAQRIGITFASFMGLGIDTGLTAARLAEELGYESFWTAETSGLEAFSSLTAAGGVAPSLGLGTGVIAIQLRTPMLAAMSAATLQALHPETDVVLGIGISSPVVTEQWHGAPYGDRPVAHIREYVALVQEILAGDAVTFEGDFYHCRRARLGVRLGDRRPKIVIGALNPAMLRLAGEVADGVLLNYLPASHVPWSVAQVHDGEARRTDGRSCTVYGYVHVGVCDRPDGIDLARRDLFSYAVVDSYARNFDRAGFGDEVAEVRERHAAKDREGALAAISDRMVDAIDVMGDEAQVRATVVDYCDQGVEVPIVMPLPWGSDRMAVIESTMRAAAG